MCRWLNSSSWYYKRLIKCKSLKKGKNKEKKRRRTKDNEGKKDQIDDAKDWIKRKWKTQTKTKDQQNGLTLKKKRD